MVSCYRSNVMPEVDWNTIVPAVQAQHTLGYFTLPAFELEPPVWKGASEIARQYNYSASKNFALRRRPNKPTDATYVLCIKYRIGDAVSRYKLWEDENLVLNGVPLYTGQIIKKNFCLEIWTLNNGGVDIVQDSALRLVSGIRRTITDFTAMPADYSDADGDAADSLLSPAVVVPSLLAPPDVAYRLPAGWWRSDSGVTLVLPDNTIDQWDDLSGNGYHLESSAPVPFVANGFGPKNKPYLLFDHAPRQLANVGWPAPPPVAFRCYYFVLQMPIWEVNRTIMLDGARVFSMAPADKQLRLVNGGNADVSYAAVGNTPLIVRVDHGFGTNRVEIRLLEDITNQVALTEAAGAGPVDALNLVIGGGGVGVSAEFRLAEMVAFDATLDAAQDAWLKNYFVVQYAAIASLPISFDSGSPWLSND